MDPILLSLKLSCRLVFLMIITGSCLHSSSPTTSCLNMAERSKWNRSFHFNNRELRLKLEVTNRPSHWIINYIFEILARERLGYQSIEFIKQNMDHPYQAISRLDCKDVNCFKIPEVHINLELWLSLGTTTNFWIPHNRVIDNGPLGPVNRWAVSSEEGFVSQLSKLMESPEKESNCQNTSHSTDQPVNAQNEECDANLCSPSDFVNEFIRYFTGSDIISSKSSSHSSSSSSFSADQQLSSSSTTMSIIDWYPSHGPGASPLPSAFHFPVKQNQINSTVSQVVVFDTIHRCTSQLDSTILDNNHQHQDVKKKSFCRFESQQATKLSWAKLKSTVPLIYQLVDRMHFSQSEYEDLLKSANSLNPNSGVDIQSHYRDVACKWIRLSPTRWSSWTEGWNKKQNLTIAGLFSFYGKWVVSNLDHVAQQAISFVNNNPDYFSNTEYALTLDVHNLTCSQDVVLNDYFDLVTKSKDQKIIGVIAALCSDSIEPVVEVANMRRQIVVSPTVESVRFARRRQYPYFFRTVPSMTHVSLILIRLFNYWGWRRVAVFREDDHFFDPLVFQSNGIELIADFVMKENQLTYITVYQGLKLMNDRRSRIFMIEYFAKGTALILCAAYHLGMHFDSGYVWFLNPWLSGNWWQSVDIHPPECTRDEMLNMTGWTFTIGHQLIMEPLMHKQNTQRQIHRRSSSSREYSRKFKHPLYNGGHDVDADHNDDDDQDYHSSSNSAESQRSVFSTKSENIDYIDSSHDYAIHTYESVIVLATALVHLLHQNPSCISVFDTSTSIAETYKELIAETDFHYTISSKFIILDNSTSSSSSSSTTYTQPMISLDTDFRYVHKKKDNNNNNNNNNGIKSAQLRFNPFNERIADYWLLRQYQVNQSIPIVLWSLQSDLLNNGETETDPNGDGDVDAAFMRSLLLDTSDLSAFVTSEHFSQLMGERWLNDVSWSSSRNNGNNGRPPHDGSENQDDCTFGVISRLFGVNCTGSTVIVTISIVITVVILCFILFIVYYRRKLKQTQLRIRQPYENLCNELKDIDIPSTDIVLNRRVGQGAFGMVYGGEAKRNGRWEAVAVKVIGNKATYEGKTDFLSEAKLMRSLDHRNIVHLIGICLYPKENHLYLIMEFMLNGDLKTYLLSRRVLAQQMPEHEGICPATLTGMAIDIAEGLAYLHRKNLIHRISPVGIVLSVQTVL
uniref:Protein kinase domain-containing protein n=1 Tax=Trichobilharzia regenti TaxID=157069 RepID=A0AA85JR31_TRIRE|nr:unnamed protein product [Trichobilharzia regenti]